MASTTSSHTDASAASRASSLFPQGKGFAAGGYWSPVPLLPDGLLDRIDAMLHAAAALLPAAYGDRSRNILLAEHASDEHLPRNTSTTHADARASVPTGSAGGGLPRSSRIVIPPRDNSMLQTSASPTKLAAATDEFGRQCLLARRFLEAGVRFVQVNFSYPRNYWDAHGDLRNNHGGNAKKVDKPVAGLLKDLRRRGLLDDTLVVWGTEFGRTPAAQGTDGRDHHPHAFSMWLAGGGTRAGVQIGETDELGFDVVSDPVHVHDLHATILHLLGFDHERLTFRTQGRDFRLTDTAGKLVSQLF